MTKDERDEMTAWQGRVEQSRRSGAYQRLKERQDRSPVSMNSLADTLEAEGQDIDAKESTSN